MKKYILTFAVTLFLFSPAATNGQFTFTTNSNNTLTITGYTGPYGPVTIPSDISGLTVTGIGAYAFEYNTNMSAVTIQANITSIGGNAFWGCSALTAVTFGYGTITIADGMFPYCRNLTNVAIPDSVTNIGSEAFFYCSSLASVAIPGSVTSIGDQAFEATGLTSVTIPDSVIYLVGGDQFALCGSLTNFSLGKGVTSVAEEMFAVCNSLSNVVLPSNITSIGDYAFYQCSNLTNVIIPAGVTNIPGGTREGRGTPFDACTSLSNVSILGYANIGEYAFYGFPLVSVYIAGGSIGASAFQFCTNLTHLTFGNRITSIAANAFEADPVSNLFIPGSVTYIRDGAFSCPGLTNVIFGAGVVSIDDQAFDQDYELTNALFLGNAPIVINSGDQPVFAASPTTVYYLPGTTGWSNSFGSSIYQAGAPTALWNPVIQTSDGHFGVHSNQFGFTITGSTNIPIVVEACTNLTNPIWTPLTNVSLNNSSFYFSDPQWTNYPVRFYRIGFP